MCPARRAALLLLSPSGHRLRSISRTRLTGPFPSPGECPGAPTPLRSEVDPDGWTRLLFDTTRDHFDMHDLKKRYPKIAEVLRKKLPKANGFRCPAPPAMRLGGPLLSRRRLHSRQDVLQSYES